MFSQVDKIEFWGGIVRCAPELLLIDAVLLGYSFFLWYRSYRRTGNRIDYWNLFCLMNIFVPILLLYPFSASFLNFISVGADVVYIDQFVDQAFIISALGYISMLVGKSLSFDAPGKLSYFEKIISDNLHSKIFFHFLTAGNFLVLIIAFYLTAAYGDYVFNLRALHFILPSWSAPLNFIISYVMYSLTFVGLHMIYEKTWADYLNIVCLIIVAILLGTRVVLVSPLLTIVMFLLLVQPSLKLTHCVFGLILLFCFTIFLSLLRADTATGNVTYSFLSFFAEILYGNTFSDLRDFSWVLTGFHDDFLYGKTYLSGIFSMIPSSWWDFRDTYGIGKITNYYAGIQFEHFGIRIGVFGEPYLNFGWAGVVAVGLILGYLLNRVNKQMIQFTKQNVYCGYAVLFPFLFWGTFITVSAFMGTIYVFIILHAIGYLLRK